jgi:hypothetical protein
MPEQITIQLREHFDQLAAYMDDIAVKQLPFAMSQAANKLASLGVAALQDEMRHVFDRPTRWILNGIYAYKGTKNDPHGEIFVKDFGGKGAGTSAEKVLSAEILGGSRNLKRFEKALGYRLGGAQFVVPGRGAKLDSYGNIARSQIQKILSALGAAEMTSGYQANRTSASARRHRNEVFFVATSHRNGKALGVYQVVSKGHVEPVLIFTRKTPTYRTRLDFYAVIRRTVDKKQDAVIKQSLEEAMRTAR